jgi:hypothetical protein
MKWKYGRKAEAHTPTLEELKEIVRIIGEFLLCDSGVFNVSEIDG